MTSQYGAYALRAGLARLYARMRINTPTRPGTHMHARTRKHAHTDQHVILVAFPLQEWLRERASVLCYTYIACLFYFCYSTFYLILMQANSTTDQHRTIFSLPDYRCQFDYKTHHTDVKYILCL